MCSFIEELITPSMLVSVGACIAAVCSCIATCGLYHMACKTHAYVKREDEMKHARSVALWIIGQNSPDFINVAIVNRSECPVYDVYVIGCPYDNDETWKKSYKVYGQRDVISPNVNEANKVYMTVEVLGMPKNLLSVTATMFFRDINGVEWCRDSHGALRKCPGYLNLFTNTLDKS